MPALNVYQQKAQDQCLGSSGKFGKHQQSLPLMSNTNSDFEAEESSDASSQASMDSRSSCKEVDHLLPLYEVSRSLNVQGDVNRRAKKVRIIACSFFSNSCHVKMKAEFDGQVMYTGTSARTLHRRQQAQRNLRDVAAGCDQSVFNAFEKRVGVRTPLL